MSDSGKAVFLSYASQDAAAAKRICEALQAAGLEVWFDQSELRGGDAWDAMIRKRIKECALFVPLITPTTNARTEGYFRLEWKLAVDRSHLMADDAPFLFPVVLGEVNDATARVPDKFREVQWTRLRLDETPAELAARVARLLSGDVAGLGEAGLPGSTTPATNSRTRRRDRPSWVRNVAIVGGVVTGLVYAIRPLVQESRAPAPQPPPVVASLASGTALVAPVSEARKLAARARVMSLDKYDSSIDDFTAAEGLVKRALELEPNDGEIWAVSSLINFAINSRGFERTPARNAAARAQAERALKLAPDSIEAQFALARWQRDGEEAAIAEASFLKILARAPDHAGALHNLGYLYDRMDRIDEAAALYAREAKNPAAAALAGFTEYLMYFRRARFPEAERAVRKSIAVEPSSNAQSGLALLLLSWQGDAGGAAAAVASGPATIRREHRPIWVTALVQLCRRKPDAALRVLDRLTDEYILDNWYTGPKAYWVGLAHAQAGREAAARVAWEEGLTVVDQRLHSTPADFQLRLARGELLALLGREREALAEARTAEQLTGKQMNWIFTPVRIHAALGRADDALRLIEPQLQFTREHRNLGWPLTPALLRIDPRWDKIRDDPRFQALCAEPAAPSPASGLQARPEPVERAPAPPPEADTKSVAVLAFANLSDDKANEYFSDGISEELLNVLAKVPALKVAARTSSFYFKGRNEPIPEIAQKLGVAYVVEGSVRKAGNKVRITAQLIKAADGFHVWSETYDRDLTDIFAVQDEIAKKILGVVKGSVLGEAELPHATTTNIEAYTLFLQAQGAFAMRGETNLREAIRLFEAALAVDPDYVPALVGLAKALVVLPNYAYLNGTKAREVTEAANKAARRALELDPQNAAAHASIGWAAFQFGWQWGEGMAEVQRARDLAPNDSWNWNLLGDCHRYAFDLPQALADKQRAWDLDPLSPNSHWDLGYTYLVAGRPDEAIQWSEKCIALAPHNMDSYMPGLLAAGRAGRLDLMRRMLAAARQNVHEGEGMLLLLEAYGAILEKKPGEARRLLAMAEPLAEGENASPGYLGYCHLLLGDADRARTWLQKGYDRHDPTLVWNELIDLEVIAADPKTRPFLDQPRIKELYELRQRNARAGLNKL